MARPLEAAWAVGAALPHATWRPSKWARLAACRRDMSCRAGPCHRLPPLAGPVPMDARTAGSTRPYGIASGTAGAGLACGDVPERPWAPHHVPGWGAGDGGSAPAPGLFEDRRALWGVVQTPKAAACSNSSVVDPSHPFLARAALAAVSVDERGGVLSVAMGGVAVERLVGRARRGPLGGRGTRCVGTLPIAGMCAVVRLVQGWKVGCCWSVPTGTLGRACWRALRMCGGSRLTLTPRARGVVSAIGV